MKFVSAQIHCVPRPNNTDNWHQFAGMLIEQRYSSTADGQQLQRNFYRRNGLIESKCTEFLANFRIFMSKNARKYKSSRQIRRL